MLQQDAIEQGSFLSSGTFYEGIINVHWVILTAIELATALCYLHANDIVHADMATSLWSAAQMTQGAFPLRCTEHDYLCSAFKKHLLVAQGPDHDAQGFAHNMWAHTLST